MGKVWSKCLVRLLDCSAQLTGQTGVWLHSARLFPSHLPLAWTCFTNATTSAQRHHSRQIRPLQFCSHTSSRAPTTGCARPPVGPIQAALMFHCLSGHSALPHLLHSHTGECRKHLPRCLPFHTRGFPSGITQSSPYIVPVPHNCLSCFLSREQEVLAQTPGQPQLCSTFPTADKQ